MGTHHIYFDDEKDIQRVMGELDSMDNDALIDLLNGEFGENERVMPGLVNEDHPFTEQTAFPPDPQKRKMVAANMSLRRRISKDYDKSFEKSLHQEGERRSWQLRTASKHISQEAGAQFNAEQLFTEMGVGGGRVLYSNPIIVPRHDKNMFNYDHENPYNQLEFFTIGEDIIATNMLRYNLGFYEQHVKDKEGRDLSAYVPVVFLDDRVMRALQQLQQSENIRVAQAAKRMLPAMQTLFMFGMHDYVHHLTLDITERGRGRQYLMGKDSALKEFRVNSDNFYEQLTEISGSQLKGITNYEFYSELLNRDLWRATFRRNPNIKKSMVRTATQFIADLKLLHDELERSHDASDRASLSPEGFSNLMMTITMSRLFRIVSVDDDIFETKFRLRDGREASFIDVCNEAPVTYQNISANESWNSVRALL